MVVGVGAVDPPLAVRGQVVEHDALLLASICGQKILQRAMVRLRLVGRQMFAGGDIPGQVNLSSAPDAEQLAQFEAAQSQLSSALSRLLVVVERYPELKATEAFRDLQAQLEGTENRITVERMRFNDATLAYNKTRRRFPTVLLAKIMGFDDKPYFESKPGAEEPPKVEF